MSITLKSPHQQVETFTSDEHAILSKWLRTWRRKTRQTKALNAAMARMEVEEDPSVPYRRIDAAVANIVLRPVERQLPQWAAVYRDRVVFAREYHEDAGTAPRMVSLLPVWMFTINWADSGPGFSWPEQYRVTYLPIFDRYVVTASADSPEAWGYCDFALGSIPTGPAASERACRLVGKIGGGRQR